jgi:hypothetical protein
LAVREVRLPDKPLTARDILAGLGPQQELKPYDDPTWAGQLGHKFEQAASGLGAGPSVTGSAGEIGQTIGGILGSLSLHDAIPNLQEAYNRFRYGQPVQGAMSVLSALPMVPEASAVKGVEKDVAENVVKNSVNVPSIRGVPVEQAIETARTEPHLIPAGQGSRSGFIGGPPDVQTAADLIQRRSDFDKYVGADPRGWDWYDRYRAGMQRATGGDEEMNRWMSPMQGSWSQGVNPSSEQGYVLKEANSAIAGQPTRANYQTQHDAFQRAIESGDPNQMQLGDKTEQYAALVNPDQPPNAGAVGVNDFRYANQWGYRPEDLETRAGKVSLTQPQHQFLDYETALAVDRANQLQLGGKSDWTGEQLQAAPWVRQKALALSDPTDPKTRLDLRGNYPAAFEEANKTAPDFYEKHAANATWEAQPGVTTGHLPGSVTASPEERQAYIDAPGSWAAAPSMGLETGEQPRDAIYGGLRLQGPQGPTGVGMYTLPSRPMTGVFEGQNNPGMVARPLVAFDTGGGAKTVSPADQSILNAGETVRSAFGAQDAGAWSKPWKPDRLGAANSYFTPLDRPATVEELTAAKAAGAGYGMPEATDTGGGILTTNFGQPQGWSPGQRKQAVASMQGAAPADATGPGGLMKTDSGYIDLTPAWKQGVGSGAVTQQMLDAIGSTPELREAFNQNPYIPGVASAQAERDAGISGWGDVRPDLQNLRLVAGEGPGWVDRVQQGLETFKATGKLSALAGGAAATGAVFTPTAGFPATPDQAPPAAGPPSALLGQGPQFDDWWRQLQNQRFAGSAQ